MLDRDGNPADPRRVLVPNGIEHAHERASEHVDGTHPHGSPDHANHSSVHPDDTSDGPPRADGPHVVA